jgi:hypothetical protein
LNSIRRYFSDLSEAFGNGWNRFWFTPSDGFSLCMIRALAGLAACYYHWSHAADLVRWFGPDGLLPSETVRRLVGTAVFRFSPLLLTESPAALWFFQLAGWVILAAFTAGLRTRVTNVLALLVVLSYVHRAPMLTGPFESVLTMLLAYLCIASSGSHLSIDRWWQNRRHPAYQPPQAVSARISLRLIQVHVAAFCLLMGLTMLAGQPWWSGEALWWLIAQTESRLVDLTGLHGYPYLINLWTHVVVGFSLLFGVLIWNRLARPLLLVLAVVIWTSLALVTGQVAFFATMLIGSLAFVSPATLRRWTAGMRHLLPRAIARR